MTAEESIRMNIISSGIMGTVRNLAKRWAESESLIPANSFVARSAINVMAIIISINLVTYSIDLAPVLTIAAMTAWLFTPDPTHSIIS